MEDLTQVFGYDGLYRWNAKALEGAKILPASKELLSNVGLPSKGDWTLSFGSSNGELERYLLRPSLLIIGYDDTVPICIDESANSRVVAAESKLNRFINTTISQFGTCLALYQTYRQEVRGMDEDAALALIEQIESKMRVVNAEAFLYEDYWWPAIVEQMKNGML